MTNKKSDIVGLENLVRALDIIDDDDDFKEGSNDFVFDYTALPTFQKVHMDANRFIYIRGPVGCFPADTEFLTPSGWKNISDYEQSDLVGQWDELTGNLEFVTPDDYVVLNQPNNFYRFHNAHSVDMVVSEEHRIPYYNWADELNITNAKYISNKIKTRTEGPRYKIPLYYNLATADGINLSDEELRVMVAVHADGHFHQYYRDRDIPKCCVALRKERKIERLKTLLEEADIEYHINGPYINRPTELIFNFVAPMLSKHYDGSWYKVNHNQAKIIYDEFKYWDGLYCGDDLRYYSTKKSDADFIQFVCHAVGHRATISTESYNQDNRSDCYVVHVTQRHNELPTFRNCCTDRVRSEDGKKYCFIVPSSYFVARYNNKIFITGNSGKSSGCIMHCFLNAMKQKPQYDGVRRSCYGVLRSSYPALKSTVIKSWKEWFGKLIKIVYDVPIRGLLTLPHPDGLTKIEMELVFIALDREDDVNKLQSLQLTGAHFNESAETEPGIIDVLKTRINRFPKKEIVKKNWKFYEEFENKINKDGKLGAVDPFIILDYNSVDTEHWLYELAEEQYPKPAKHSFYHQPSALLMVEVGKGVITDAAGNEYIRNPDADNYENLDDDYYIDMVAGADPDFVNVLVMNNYGAVRKGKPVYSDYQDDYHFSEKLVKPIKGIPIIIGLDLGLQPAAAFMQLSPTGQLVIFDELVTTDCSLITFCESYLQPHIFTHYNDFTYSLIVDPAATQRSQNDAKTAAEILGGPPPYGYGLPYRPGMTQNPMKRREAVNYFLRKKDGLSIGPKCIYARKGFISGYCYEKVAASKSTRYKDKPEKNIYSHIHDAIQYGALECRGGRGYKQARSRLREIHEQRVEEYKLPDEIAGY